MRGIRRPPISLTAVPGVLGRNRFCTIVPQATRFISGLAAAAPVAARSSPAARGTAVRCAAMAPPAPEQVSANKHYGGESCGCIG